VGVNNNVSGLVSELKNRCVRLIRLLNTDRLLPDVHDLRDEAVERLKHTYTKLCELERDELLQQLELQPQAISAYQELFQEVVLVEEILVPVLIGYDDHDHHGFLWLRKFAEETRFPAEGIPSITTKSDHYYWTYPELRIVGMPIGDIEGILGWPDLVHELGHILLAIRPGFLREFTPIVRQYFQGERDSILDLGGQPQANKWINIAQIKWSNKREGTWREEIACDLMATHFMGAAYGWQHLRLVTNRDKNPYHPLPRSANHSTTHPADQARLEAILAMLRIMKQTASVKRLEAAWQQMLEARHYGKRPQGFAVYYPQSLIKKLARIVFEQCQNMQLIPYSEQETQDELDIVALVSRAWTMFQEMPTQYGDWEKKMAHKFWQQLKTGSDYLLTGQEEMYYDSPR
jgi:hypothetical protein